MKRIIRFSSCLVLLLITYIPTLLWMVDRWSAPESYYGHGFLIPLVSAFFILQKRSLLQKERISGSLSGLFIVLGALVVHIICALLKVYSVSGFSFVFALYGLTLFFFGKEFTRHLIFPIFFLLAMIPLPLVLIGNLTVKLKLFVAQVATILLNNIGFPSIREGSMIKMPNSYVMVEAPCSGLRSLISLITLGLIFSYVIKASYIKKAVLFLSSIPIALATNVIRVTMLGIVNDLYGEKVAMGFFHDFSGFMMFAIAFVCLYFVSKALESQKHAMQENV